MSLEKLNIEVVVEFSQFLLNLLNIQPNNFDAVKNTNSWLVQSVVMYGNSLHKIIELAMQKDGFRLSTENLLFMKIEKNTVIIDGRDTVLCQYWLDEVRKNFYDSGFEKIHLEIQLTDSN